MKLHVHNGELYAKKTSKGDLIKVTDVQMLDSELRIVEEGTDGKQAVAVEARVLITPDNWPANPVLNAWCKLPPTHLLLKAIFGDENGGVFATVTVSSDAEPALAFMETLQYNAFDGLFVAPYLRGLFKDGNLLRLRFGREYGPVLYLTVKNACSNQVQEALRKLCADEVDVVSGDAETHVIRAWFD
jgi:hypothetical protein